MCQGLLLKRLDLWQSGTVIYPVINQTQELALTDLLTQIIFKPTKLKPIVCQCYFNNIHNISGLKVPSDKEELAINEANKS